MRRFLLLGLFLLPADTNAQVVRGIVLADGDDAPIGAVTVALIDQDGVVRDSAVTDSTGGFLVSTARPGGYTLRAEHLAYETVARAIELSRGFEVRVELRMAANAIALEPLVITSTRELPLQSVGFYVRSRAGTGRFLTREDIERRRPIRTTDLFQTIPRLSFISGPGNMGPPVLVMSSPAGGACEPGIFINGSPGMGARDLDMIRPEDIEGIEVYTSVAFTPIEYQRRTGCGVILLWLREDDSKDVFTWLRVIIGLGIFAGLLIVGS